MHITERHVGISVQVLMIIGFVIIIFLQLPVVPQSITLIRIVCLTLVSLILFLYLRGFAYAPVLLVLCGSVIITLVVDDSGYNPSNAYVLLLPAIIAMVLTRPRWIAVAAILTPLLFLLRPQAFLWKVTVFFWVIYTMIMLALMLARFLTDMRMKETRQAAQLTEIAHIELEQRSLALSQANTQQQEQLQEQQRLLELISTLEAPVVQIANGVLLAPMIGHMDTYRTRRFTERLLQEIYSQRVRLTILDISGVSLVDTSVAQTLMESAHAIRLLGCKVAFSGISAQVAMTMTQLGVDLNEIVTVQSPQIALDMLAQSQL